MRVTPLLTVTLLVAAIAGPLLAQEAVPGGPPADAPAAAPNPAVAIAHDVELLQTIRGLQLSDDEIHSILLVLEPLQKQEQALRGTEDAIWQRSGDNIGKVYEAWAAAKAPDGAVKADADKAAKEYDAANAELDNAVAQAAEQIRGLLTRDQSALIESAQAERRRHQAEGTLSGASSLAEYVARRIEALRGLMPDEYGASRINQAEDIAALVVGPRARDFDAVVDRVLRAFDDAMNWTPEQFQANRPQLPSMVAKALGLPDVTPPLLKYGEWLALVRDPRLFALLTQLGGGAEAPDPAPEQPGPHNLDVAITLAHNLTIINDLRLTPTQLAQLSPIIAALTSLVQGGQTAAASRRTPLQAQLQDARRELLAGQNLDEVTAASLNMLAGADRKAQREDRHAAAAALETVRRMFTDRQNALIDWRPPAGPSGAQDVAEQTAQAKKVAEEMHSASDFLVELRYMPADLYLTVGRQREIEFIQRYTDADVRTPEFQRDLAAVNTLTARAKLLTEQAWVRDRADLTRQLLRTVGAVGIQQAAAPGNRRYDWQTMFDLFSYPKTAAMVAHIIEVRGR